MEDSNQKPEINWIIVIGLSFLISIILTSWSIWQCGQYTPEAGMTCGILILSGPIFFIPSIFLLIFISLIIHWRKYGSLSSKGKVFIVIFETITILFIFFSILLNSF